MTLKCDICQEEALYGQPGLLACQNCFELANVVMVRYQGILPEQLKVILIQLLARTRELEGGHYANA